jgi:Kdo2-lipid IVA lauroyltransferase/acyltransferase
VNGVALREYSRHWLNCRPVYAMGSWILENFPPPVGYGITRGFAELAYRVTPGRRGPITDNVRHVLRATRPDASADEIERIVRPLVHRLFWRRGDWFADLSMFATRRSIRSMVRFDIRGDWSTVQKSVASGRGAILVSAHLGNWPAGSLLVGRNGVPVRNVIFHNDQADFMYRGVARHADIEPIFVGEDMFSILRIVRALRSGAVIAMLGDIPWDSRRITLPFFGAPAEFPIGPARLARLAGVALFPAFCLTRRPRVYEAHLLDPIEPGTGDPDAVERAMTESLVRIYEDMIASNLDQWFNFTRIWKGATDR